MAEKRTVLRPVRVDYCCDQCGGVIETGPHERDYLGGYYSGYCFGCRRDHRLDEPYPRIVYEDVPEATP
jgi:hypothetical protein